MNKIENKKINPQTGKPYKRGPYRKSKRKVSEPIVVEDEYGELQLVSIGRSTFEPSMCQSLVNYMSKGHSLKSWCGQENISYRTFRQWAVHPVVGEMLQEAYDIGYNKALDFFEKLLLSAATGAKPINFYNNKIKKGDITKDMISPTFDTNAIMFILKTRFWEVYKEKATLEIGSNQTQESEKEGKTKDEIRAENDRIIKERELLRQVGAF